MALIMNHNLPALRAARFVGSAYRSLSKSIERLSSGLRINSVADDAAGLAVRELMRADIAARNQGIRNASDGVSLVQTADGALEVIGAKLIKMMELAQQATNQASSAAYREIINSEYQAMAAAIDHIAASTSFNDVRLLDGSLNALNNGQGLKIHYGTGNSPDADYIYIDAKDTRATSVSGLMIGGDGKNDMWSIGPYGKAAEGCCGGKIASLSDVIVTTALSAFGYGYNWDGLAASETELFNGRYLAGMYGFEANLTYEELVGKVNMGTQSRVGLKIDEGTSVTGRNIWQSALIPMRFTTLGTLTRPTWLARLTASLPSSTPKPLPTQSTTIRIQNTGQCMTTTVPIFSEKMEATTIPLSW
jgi:flagellin